MESSSTRKLKFLLVAPSYACKPITGGGQRTSLIYQALTQLGEVDVLLLGYQDADVFKPYFPGANALYIVKPDENIGSTFWRLIRPASPRLVDGVASVLGGRKLLYQPDSNIGPFLNNLQDKYSYDFVVGRYLRPSARAGALHTNKVPVVLDIDDRDDVIYKSRINRPGTNPLQRLIFQRYIQQMKVVMADLLPRCQHVWLASDQDLGEVQHPSKSVLPNIPYTSSGGSQTLDSSSINANADSKTVLFVGSFGHRVNREGVERFITRCWPAIHSAVDGANLRIVGSGGWESIKDDFSHLPAVNIVGFVDSLEKEYEQAAFAIAPLFEGGGTKIKVLESLFYHRTAVVTSYAQYGYETLKHKKSLWVCMDEAALIQGCTELLNNPNLRSQMAADGHTQVIQRYSFGYFSDLVNKTVSSLLKPLD